MNQQTRSAQPTLKTSRQRPLWMQSLACLGGIGLLSAGTLGAQTAPVDSVVVPAISEPQSALEATPIEAAPVDAPAVVAEPEQFAPEASAEFAPELAPEPAIAAQEEPVPSLAVPTQEEPIAAPPAANSPDAVAAGSEPPNYNNAYIDPTRYNLGATDPYEQPSSVVLSERSTGCQAVLSGGQGLSGGICGTASEPASAQSAPWRPGSVENTWASTSGGSQGDSQWVAASNSPAVQLGPINISARGIGIGQTTASGRSFYYQTARPTGRLGNGNLRLIFPLSLPAPITSIFGWRIHPISGDSRFHSGTDLGAPMGTPVVAAYAGKVAIADFLGGYGLTVTIDHNKGKQETLYAHLSEIFVKPGEVVKQGAVIGRVGSTGNSTGPHLHFELRQQTANGWVTLDPGAQLELAAADLIKSLQTAQTAAKPVPQPQG
ncbi:peptidoglycan DD-metalloendopeptidase family protein [Trichocoleus sp. FACHB-262]|uniref:peptidoglycan DD-metalloendopeptidase family protein n=1 Tax=Trichocoleus sp. FACHB-262 TaxID=2692869 RepID=UPI0024119684|nr:peptidoglycan DD-metalloendopeptidase family protein [Trichocoleus sp. FACHB-262]